MPRFLLTCLAFLLTSSATFAAPPAASVDTIGGRQVESLTIRPPDARATVVFEAGLRGTIATWGTVPEAIGRSATVFAYNRPGYGRSEAAATPRDGRTIVDELRGLLRAKGLPPPYVLVGHSLGGLYMQLFARVYPQEVRGIVLVDALYPRTIKKSSEFPLLTRIAGRLALSRVVWQEIDKGDATGEAVLALDAADELPMIRLVNVPKGAGAMPVDFGAFRTDAASREFVRGLYPKSKKVVVDSAHQMQLETPAVVIAAIQELVDR